MTACSSSPGRVRDRPQTVEIARGPNIGDPPKNAPLPAAIEGQATIKVGDKITTDHIMPAGQLLKYRSNVPKYATYVFSPVDPTFAERAIANRDASVHNVIVAGESYGQGSSREHAALCPMYLGVKAVIAKSFERIHIANLINFGIVPLTFVDPADYDRIQTGDALIIPDIRTVLGDNKPISVENRTQVWKSRCRRTCRSARMRILLAGGLLNTVSGV
jgi:aconitate hydratase